MKHCLSLLAGATLLACSAAHASPARVQTGSFGELSWTAANTIVGQTSTATAAAGGNPLYFAAMPKYNGVAYLVMDYGSAGSFVCSGTLLPSRAAILTAAHCVSNGMPDRPLSTTVHFYTGSNPDTHVSSAPTFSYEVSHYNVHDKYTGDVIDQNDIAILRLSQFVDSSVNSYELYTNDLTGVDYNVAGYGGRSTVGGATGVNTGTGRLRQGNNRYDYRLGDADFGGVWSPILGQPAEQIAYTYLADFDNGTATNDANCRIATNGIGLAASAKYCDTGRGATEVSTAGGDSGGPQFVDGKIASVTSFGLSFGGGFGDAVRGLQSSFGELNGFVPVSIHEDFIRKNSVPEPVSLALVGTALLAGGFARRSKKA